MSAVRAAPDFPQDSSLSLPDIPTVQRTIGGVRVQYADLPPQRASAGSPVLWIHGLGGWLRNWAPNLHACTALGYRCIAIDLPGFGDSAKPDAPYHAAYFRGFLTEFLDTLGIEQATLVGNSMGGMIALSMAQRSPHRVDRLVLVDAAGVHRLYGTAVRVTGDLVRAVVFHGGRPSRIMQAMRHWVFEQTPPELIEELELEFAKYARESPRDRRRRARAYTRALWGVMRTNLRRWLPTVSAPTLVVHGKQDKLVPFEAASILHREIPGARIAAFDRCGHCPQLELPEKFNARLAEFMSTAPARIRV